MDDRILIRFLQNEASEEEVREVVKWAKESPENQRYLNSLDFVDSALLFWGPKLRRRSLNERRTRMPDWRTAVKWVSSVAAVLLLGLCSGYLFLEYDLSRLPEVTYVSSNSQSTLCLTDGTKVWLTPGSRLTYPTRFRGKERNVKLSGEAIFDVTPDRKHPFVVETFACSAKVLGTHFDIVADESHNEFSAALLSGRLQITHAETKNSVILLPNEIVRLSNGTLVKQPLKDRENYQWKDGIINLRGLTFMEIVQRFEANFNVRFVIRCEKLPTVDFGWGKVFISSGIEHAMDVLQHGADFDYTFDRAENTITIE